MVGMSDAHHNRVVRGTHVSRTGRRGGRSTLRATACMLLQRKARQRGQGKIIFSAYSGSSIRCHGLKRQPHGINRDKRGGHSGQNTRKKRGHEPGVLVHYATANQFQNRRHTGSKYMLRACDARHDHSEKDRKKSEKGVPSATPKVCSRWNAAVPSPWSKWLWMRRRSWSKASGPRAWASRLRFTCEKKTRRTRR